MGGVERTGLRNLYLYLVCLITLIIGIFATVSVVRDAVQLVYPNPSYYATVTQPSPQDQERDRRAARDSERHQAVLELVGSATMLLVAGPVYLYHWRRVQSEARGHSADVSAAREPPTASGAD